MPDFDLQIISGVRVERWLDPPSATQPCRLNPRRGRSMLRMVATPGATVVFAAYVNGVPCPVDSELGGRLFSGVTVEAPHPYPVELVPEPGQTSVQFFTPSAEFPGHYLIAIRRHLGGMVYVHLDVEEAVP